MHKRQEEVKELLMLGALKKNIAESGLCDKGEGDGMKEKRGKCVWGMKNDGRLELDFVILVVEFK